MNNNMFNLLSQFINVSNNPNTIIQMLINQNPQYRQVFNQMQSSGMSPKDFVNQYAKQNNIDISPIVNEMKKRGIKL